MLYGFCHFKHLGSSTYLTDETVTPRQYLLYHAELDYDFLLKIIKFAIRRGTGLGSSKFPHLNYKMADSTKGHLFLKDKISNTGLMDSFKSYFK